MLVERHISNMVEAWTREEVEIPEDTILLMSEQIRELGRRV